MDIGAMVAISLMAVGCAFLLANATRPPVVRLIVHLVAEHLVKGTVS
ncbi:hypothetical protein AB0E59_05620 [Lentzea sp. NPDC034063]